jgi:hypothetical protein
MYKGELSANPIFNAEAKLALVQMRKDEKRFGVAMRGGKYVVQLPLGYDGMTSIRWFNGWIIVAHPNMPPLLADTTTGKAMPLDQDQLQAFIRDVKRALNVPAAARVIQ